MSGVFESEDADRESATREISRLGIFPLVGDGHQFTLMVGSEPVPGHRLVARVGLGGSGEVWRAIGPGGFPVALKFVRMTEGSWDVETSSPVSLRSARETNLRSLELIRELRHPHLLTMFGAWERDGLLIIGMELADRTLMDRLDEAVAAGLPGIPLPELLAMMRQVARGIDYLNTPGLIEADREGAGIQHRDIKPQNLLLTGDVVKLGDFGLAKLRDDLVSKTSSLTATYAAPELFKGKVSSRSDQYALAVTYCQLRGGALPFGGSLYEVMIGHCMSHPDLGMIPASERPAVARALAKDPDDRWPDCRAFVEAIAQGASTNERRAMVTRPGRGAARRAVLLAVALVSCLAFSSLVPGLHHSATPPDPGVTRTIAPPRLTPEPREAADSARPEPPRDLPAPAVIVPSVAVSEPVQVEVAATPAVAPEPREPGDSAVAELAESRPEPPRDLPAVSVIAPSDPAPEPDPSRLPATIAAPPEGATTTPAESVPPPTTPPAMRIPTASAGARRVLAGLKQALSQAASIAAVLHPADAPRPALAPLPAPTVLLPPPARSATIQVLMPSSTAELAVRGAVGKGQPDEWYGPRRVIHTPPMTEDADYLVGAFWFDPSGAPQTRNCRLHVKPGITYEVDLRPATPSFRLMGGDARPLPPPPGDSHEDLRHYRGPGGGPVIRK